MQIGLFAVWAVEGDNHRPKTNELKIPWNFSIPRYYLSSVTIKINSNL
jgi:hypothetical protein